MPHQTVYPEGHQDRSLLPHHLYDRRPAGGTEAVAGTAEAGRNPRVQLTRYKGRFTLSVSQLSLDQ